MDDLRTTAERKAEPRIKRRKIALVLGGGGLKGFAHIGVLKALDELGLKPALYAGTSIGSLIAAAYVTGMSIDDMAAKARGLRRRDLFRLNRLGFVLERPHAAGLYQGAPLREVCDSVVKDVRFDELTTPLLVNTVDLPRGSPVVWGLPGLTSVSVRDAVYASCALPGFYPPGQVGSRTCVDGGVIDNLPVNVASLGMDAVIAVDTGSSALLRARDIAQNGFSAIYMRAATTMMHALQLYPLETWTTPPMTLVRPRIAHISWFSFTQADELMEAGYLAAKEALQHFEADLKAEGGIYPRRRVQVSVNRDKCIGCTLCVALAPRMMAMDEAGKAVVKVPIVDWSPADGEFVHHCPTYAINAVPLSLLPQDNQPQATEAQTLQEKAERLETA